MGQTLAERYEAEAKEADEAAQAYAHDDQDRAAAVALAEAAVWRRAAQMAREAGQG